ncbi:LRRTM2 [Branchiostoma lanceolatum]|uniref:LRRTM2 protein n=1 Tax=Branchiostoma lanceolatum TaxID=7740 RepID=A0A8K0A024_BRALA|nr:LRRTM2 [Branchiostoma lanceolatum]
MLSTGIMTLLLVAIACVAVDSLCFPSQCRRVSWVECKLEYTRPSQQTSTDGGEPCILCNNPDKVSIKKHKLKLQFSLALVEDRITEIEEKALKGFTGLLRLNLAMNELTHVKQGWFVGLGKLQHVILSHNKITQIDPRSFDNLTLSRLELKGNLLATVHPDWFYGLNRYRPVHTVSLASNPIASIPPRAFRNVPDIRSLDLGLTALSCMDKDVFWGLQSLKSLNLSGTILYRMDDEPTREMQWSFFTRVSFFGKQDMHVHVSLEGLDFLSCVEHDPKSNKTKLFSLFGSTTIVWEEVAASRYGSCPKLGDSQNNGTTQPPFVVIVSNRSSHALLASGPKLCSQAWEHSGGLTLALGSAERLSLQLIPLSTYRNASSTTVAMVFDHPPNNSTANYVNSSHDNVRTGACFSGA